MNIPAAVIGQHVHTQFFGSLGQVPNPDPRAVEIRRAAPLVEGPADASNLLIASFAPHA